MTRSFRIHNSAINGTWLSFFLFQLSREDNSWVTLRFSSIFRSLLSFYLWLVFLLVILCEQLSRLCDRADCELSSFFFRHTTLYHLIWFTPHIVVFSSEPFHWNNEKLIRRSANGWVPVTCRGRASVILPPREMANMPNGLIEKSDMVKTI